MSYEATLLIVNETTQVLARSDGSAIVLPRIKVEPGRVGVSLTLAVREQLQLEVFQLVPAGSSDLPWYVMRLQGEDQILPSGHYWTKPSEISNEPPSEAHVTVYSCIEDTEIGRYGWYSEVESWLSKQLSILGYTIRSLEQWNGRVGGVLLRVATNGPQLWFKAVSHFNLREISIAQMLAEKHPTYFPRVLATQSNWNAFLLEHVNGAEVYESHDVTIWKKVAAQLAEVQIDWVGKTDQLLRAGAADLRAESLAARIPSFIELMSEKLARQTRKPSLELTRVDLEELGDYLYTLCSNVAALPYACGLANADFSPHNTLITDQGPVFIDWAEACVSLPLVTGEYLWNRMVVESPERAPWQDTLRETYFDCWAKAYGRESVDQAIKLLPGFAIYAVSVFYLDGKGETGDYDDYLRSLTRRLFRTLKAAFLNRYSTSAQ